VRRAAGGRGRRRRGAALDPDPPPASLPQDLGHDPAAPTTRLYATAAAQPWHNDSADLVSLLCLSPAAKGGASRWSSSAAIYNSLLASNPAAVATLTARGTWYYDRKGEVPAGKEGFFEMPILNFVDGAPSSLAGATPSGGRLAVNLSSNYYVSAQRFPEVPRLTDAQRSAVASVEALADSPAFALAHDLAPGDIQLLNNHVCLHTRSAFEDGEGAVRHLLRLWLAPETEGPLPAVYEELYGGSLAVGARGGIRVDGVMLKERDVHVSLEAA